MFADVRMINVWLLKSVNDDYMVQKRKKKRILLIISLHLFTNEFQKTKRINFLIKKNFCKSTKFVRNTGKITTTK